jgi:CRP/FNR family cyclic AMP-dependent transcriptional regulator
MDEARLQAIPLFSGLSKKERRVVARLADEVDVEPGCRLVRQGEFAYEFFAIEAGTAEVRRGEQYLDELGPGDFCGEMGLVEGAKRGASVTATSRVTAMVMTASAFRHIDREMPAVAKRIRRAIEDRRHQLEAVF